MSLFSFIIKESPDFYDGDESDLDAVEDISYALLIETG